MWELPGTAPDHTARALFAGHARVSPRQQRGRCRSRRVARPRRVHSPGTPGAPAGPRPAGIPMRTPAPRPPVLGGRAGELRQVRPGATAVRGRPPPLRRRRRRPEADPLRVAVAVAEDARRSRLPARVRRGGAPGGQVAGRSGPWEVGKRVSRVRCPPEQSARPKPGAGRSRHPQPGWPGRACTNRPTEGTEIEALGTTRCSPCGGPGVAGRHCRPPDPSGRAGVRGRHGAGTVPGTRTRARGDGPATRGTGPEHGGGGRVGRGCVTTRDSPRTRTSSARPVCQG